VLWKHGCSLGVLESGTKGRLARKSCQQAVGSAGALPGLAHQAAVIKAGVDRPPQLPKCFSKRCLRRPLKPGARVLHQRVAHRCKSGACITFSQRIRPARCSWPTEADVRRLKARGSIREVTSLALPWLELAEQLQGGRFTQEPKETG